MSFYNKLSFHYQKFLYEKNLLLSYYAFCILSNANSQSTTQVAVSEQQAFDLVMQKYDANQVDVFLLQRHKFKNLKPILHLFHR